MRQLYRGKYLSLHQEGHWEYVSRHHCRGAVVLVPVTPQRELVLVEQYRIPLQAKVLELPAGLVGDEDAEESWEQAAYRELIEETGYEAGSLEFLLEGPSSPGLSSEKIRLYLATELKKVGEGGGDASEEIYVHVIPLFQIQDYLKNYQQQGGMIDFKIYAGLGLIEKNL